MARRILVSLAVVFVSFSWALARQPEPSENKGAWSVEDVLQQERARQFDLSPDGQWAVWVKSAMDKKKGRRVSNLFLSNLASGEEIQLTRGPYTHARPRWSPDGKLISFLSSRPLPPKGESGKKEDDAAAGEDLAKTQLWLINPHGGEPWPVTRLRRDIQDYGWKDAHIIVFAAQEDPTLYEEEVKKRKDTSTVVEDALHEPPVRLFLLDVQEEQGKITRLTRNDDWIDDLGVSPDGHWGVTRHQRSLSFVYDAKVPPVLFLTNLDTGEMTPVAQEQRLAPGEVEWAKDSGSFTFTTEYSSDPEFFTATITLLYHYDLSTQRLTRVDLQWENGLTRSADVQATDDGFIALLADGLRFKPARYTGSGGTYVMKEIAGPHARNMFDWKLARDGQTLVYEHSTASRPAQWYRARLDGTRIEGAAQLTHLNPSFEKKPLPRSEVVQWKGANDDVVEGLLYYPNDYQEGKRYPLVLMIHGGPSGTDMDEWDLGISRQIPLFTQRNAFVLRVNYHGSGNYGLEWVESICCGKYYDLEPVDLMNGVDAMIERGLADPDKLGVMGWSNGAILTTELVTRSRRFKAASAGAGDVEWISDWANVDFGKSFDNYYFGDAPYKNPELYVRKSPYFRLKDVTTPTIIYTGTEDRNVPPSQSWSHYRVLQQATDTPVKFILFPGEPHGPRKYVHQQRKLEEDMVWFDKYLFGTYQEPNEAFREGSQLATALKKKNIAKVGLLYGLEVKGTLIPEVVAYKGLELGRFEVTRAQFAAFDHNYEVEPGTENYPANGISFQQAQAYAAWLSELAGDTYRLPGNAEAKTLYEQTDGTQNTLDSWAGYPLNPDDAERLRKKVAGLPGAAPLLLEVGRFSGVGDNELVFDLGGNAAEWVIGADGEGKLMGGSAERPADPKARGQEAGTAYRGFRVIRRQPQAAKAEME